MQTSVDLKQHQTQRINQLITNFAKTDPTILKYSQVIMLMLDRCIFSSSKFTLGDFQVIFGQIYNKGKERRLVQDEKAIAKDQLIALFNEIAKVLFKSDAKYLHRFYNTFLSENVDNENGQINRSRVMVFDATNSKLLVEQCVRKIAEYEEELRHIFIAYLFENYWSIKKSKRILLSLQEIILQNKKWSYPSLIHFFKDSQTTPHLVSIEHMEEVLRLIIQNVNSKQQQFYSRHVLSDGYHKQVENNQTTTHAGDPGVMFFEFQLLIARIALDSYPKQLEKKGQPSMGDVLERYFSYLMFRKNEQISKPLPNINRKMISVMKEYYKIIDAESHKDDKKEIPQDLMTAFEKLAKKMKKEVEDAPELGIDFQDCFKNLDKQLPKLPPLPVIEPQYLPPYKKQIAITIGVQPPPEPVQGNDKVKVEKKKDGGKKDEPPPRQFKWATVPQTKLSGEDYLKQISSKLNFEVTPLSSIERGTIKRQVYPIIIGETLCPPEMPKQVAPHLTAATNAMIDRNYILAIDNYNNGASAWKRTMIEFDPAAELFFEYSKGSVYMCAGKNQYAFQQFYLCRKFSDPNKIPFSNPDRSLPYFGLGQVFYEMEEYELSARSFLKAREIRESVLGLEHVQTASVFNNLAACYFMLGRKQQALGYIQIAQVVLDMQLGQHHERTMTSRFNLNLISHGTIDNKPEFRKFWQVFEEDKFEKKKKKKKDKEGKKK